MINLKIAKAKNPKTKEDVFVVKQVAYTRITNRQLAKSIARNSQISLATVVLALSAIQKSIINFVLNGHSVYVAGLGLFRLTLKGPGAENPEDARPTKETKAMLRFLPDSELKKTANETNKKLLNI